MTRDKLFPFGPVHFTAIRRSDLAPLVRQWAAEGAPSRVMTLTGAHGVAEALADEEVRRAHEEADYVLCDGTPPFLGAVLRGHGRLVDRIPGRDAMREIAAAAAEAGVEQVFVGGPPGLAERARAGLGSAIGHDLAGAAWSPPFVQRVTPEYACAIAERLNSAAPRPAIVWIGLSTPKQEMLASALRSLAPSGYFFIAVGAAFDMYAGTRLPAPQVFSRLGLEWLYRSVQEPRRLPRRYARALPVVLGALAAAAWAGVRRR